MTGKNILKHPQSGKLYASIILTIIALISLILELSTFWFGDNITYGFYPYLHLPEEISRVFELMPVKSMREVIEANNLNYLSINGRYVAHFFVILFCGILGKGCFAVCNALVWVVFVTLLMRVSDRRMTDTPSLLACAAISLYLMLFIGNGPAIQINYIWMFSLTLGWILLFNRTKEGKYNPAIIVLLGIFSLIAGNGQEGLNIGICGALLVLLFVRRFRFSPAEWAMGICFAVGCLADCLSPGTLSRSGGSTGGSFAFRILQFVWVSRDLFSIPLLFLTIVIALSKGYNRQQFSKNRFFWWALIVCIIFLLALGNRSGNQYFGMMLLTSILILRIWSSNLTRNILSGLILIFCLYSLYCKYRSQVSYDQYMTSVEQQYNASLDGTVFINAANPSSPNLFSDHNVCIVLRNGQKKHIMVLPDEIKEIKSDSIVNSIKQYSPNRFMVIQSKIAPKQFNYDLSFRFLNYIRPISNDHIDFSNPLYETDTYRILMINGYPFLHHEITIDENS